MSFGLFFVNFLHTRLSPDPGTYLRSKARKVSKTREKAPFSPFFVNFCTSAIPGPEQLYSSFYIIFIFKQVGSDVADITFKWFNELSSLADGSELTHIAYDEHIHMHHT